MKQLICVAVVILYVSISNAKLSPRQTKFNYLKQLSQKRQQMDSLNMDTTCVSAVKRQIQDEIDASIKYLSMGAYFSEDVIDQPGFAEFFFQSASAKREHAIMLIEYLLKRMTGTSLHNFADLIEVNAPDVTPWKSGAVALEEAISIEATITQNIELVIQKCENSSKNKDYHVVDYLTTELLDKQYQAQRNLASKISTLTKIMQSESSDSIGEFLFDKELLH